MNSEKEQGANESTGGTQPDVLSEGYGSQPSTASETPASPEGD